MEKKSRAKKAEKKPESFQVQTRGYSETFSNLDLAKKQFEILKKRAIKNQEKVKIQIFENKSGQKKEVDHVVITEQFYQE